MNFILRYIRNYYLTIIYTLMVLFLCLMPSSGMQVDVKISDKVVHFLMFFVLTLLLWGEYTFHYIYKKIRWNGQLLYPLSIGILTELLQHYATSYRTGDFYDLLADIGGTLSAFLIGYIICHYIKKDIQK